MATENRRLLPLFRKVYTFRIDGMLMGDKGTAESNQPRCKDVMMVLNVGGCRAEPDQAGMCKSVAAGVRDLCHITLPCTDFVPLVFP